MDLSVCEFACEMLMLNPLQGVVLVFCQSLFLMQELADLPLVATMTIPYDRYTHNVIENELKVILTLSMAWPDMNDWSTSRRTNSHQSR